MEDQEAPQFSMTFGHSLGIAKIADALSKAQSEFETVVKDSDNPYFKSEYADLATIIKATKTALSKNGLAIIQSPGAIVENKVLLTSMLVHSSGEWFRGETMMPMSKPDAQGMGSALTYARRYAYQSLVSVAGESDDDGNAAAGKTQSDRGGKSTDKNEATGRNINTTQQRAFWAAVKTAGKTPDQVAEYFKSLNISETEQLLKIDFDTHMKWAVSPMKLPGDLTEKLHQSVELLESQKLMKRVFAMAKEKNVPEEDLKRYAYETFAVESLKALSAPQLKQLGEWLSAA